MSGEQKRLDTMLEQISVRKVALNQRLLEQQSTEVDLQKNLQSFQEAYDQVTPEDCTEQQKLEVQIGQKLEVVESKRAHRCHTAGRSKEPLS